MAWIQDNIDSYKDWYSNSQRDEGDCNASIKGYYVNQKWQSDEFPNELREKIFSADEYFTYINYDYVLLIVMEHNDKLSLYYNLFDQ